MQPFTLSIASFFASITTGQGLQSGHAATGGTNLLAPAIAGAIGLALVAGVAGMFWGQGNSGFRPDDGGSGTGSSGSDSTGGQGNPGP